MKILAVDLGDARTGLAICDEGELLAYPVEVVHERSPAKILEKVADAARKNNAAMVIVGHPKNMNNTTGERAKISEEFAAGLREELGLPVELWDERGTTIAAHTALNSGTTKGRKKKQVVDAVAATILLESYLARRKSR